MPIPFDPLAQRYPSQRFPLYAVAGWGTAPRPRRQPRARRRCGRAAAPWTPPWLNGVLVGGTESRTDSNIALR